MSRVKRGTLRTKKRKNILKHTKGFKWRRKNVHKIAVDAMRHSLRNQYIGRKQKKRTMRSLWQIKINAAAREHGMNYNSFMHGMKKKHIDLDRKVLATLAEHEPETFKVIVETVKK